jgi:hypothetical protein
MNSCFKNSTIVIKRSFRIMLDQQINGAYRSDTNEHLRIAGIREEIKFCASGEPTIARGR